MFLLKNSLKLLTNRLCISSLSLFLFRKGHKDARNLLGNGSLYTLSIITETESPYSSRNLSNISFESIDFIPSATNFFPSTAPLPSSPRIKPSGGILFTILLPSYSHEFEPVPRIAAIPAFNPHAALAAPSRSLSTSIVLHDGTNVENIS